MMTGTDQPDVTPTETDAATAAHEPESLTTQIRKQQEANLTGVKERIAQLGEERADLKTADEKLRDQVAELNKARTSLCRALGISSRKPKPNGEKPKANEPKTKKKN